MDIGTRNGSRGYKDSLWDMLGGKGKVLCSNCGHITGALATELDHNVPLALGGYDVLSNVKPLCHICHSNKHYYERVSEERSRRIKEGQARSDKVSGRPRNVPDNYKELLDRFINCRISREELAKCWGLQTTSRKGEKVPVNFVHLSEQIWYREYLDELGIQKVVNKVGHPTRDYYSKGIVGYIVYKSGETKYVYADELQKAE